MGLWDFVIIFGILLLVFGTARFGRAWRGLKAGGKGFAREVRGKDELPPPPPPSET
jgi:Sec-independent protein translocase protein TatA